jgi:hypothetical protein
MIQRNFLLRSGVALVLTLLLCGCAGKGKPGRESNAEQDPMNVVFLTTKCTERGKDGQCNKATCKREKDPNSPFGSETASCARFLITCQAYGHQESGTRDDATCTRKVKN